MIPEEFHALTFHRNMDIELNNGERYPLLAVDFNNELLTFRANDNYITHATINYVSKVIDRNAMCRQYALIAHLRDTN